MLPHISIKERSIQKITDVLIHKRFRENSEYFKVSHNEDQILQSVNGGNGFTHPHPTQRNHEDSEDIKTLQGCMLSL